MPTRSNNRALLFALLALLLLAAGGGGLFLLLRPTAPQQVSGPTPVPNAAAPGSTGSTGATPAQVSPIKAEAGDTVVTLTWQPVGGATGYFVHRDGGRDPLNVKPLTETRYQDIGLTNGRTYTYTVAPVTGGVEGSLLPPVQVAPTSPEQ